MLAFLRFEVRPNVLIKPCVAIRINVSEGIQNVG
jgi:hypothetical protein